MTGNSLVPSGELTKEQFERVLPKHIKVKVTPDMVKSINEVMSDQLLRENYRDNLLSYTNVMQNGKFKIQSYIDAVRYVSFKLMGSSNIEAYTKAFPDRFARLIGENADDKTISSYVSAFAKNILVNKIMEQTMIPVHIYNADNYQKAINKQVVLMNTAHSEKVQSDAANSLLTHLKPPEVKKIELDIGENIYSPRSKLLKKVEPYIDKVPESVQTGYKWAYMTHSSPPYKLLMKITQYSDFVARYTLYTHEINKSSTTNATEKNKAHEDALAKAVETFINYDIPTGTAIQYGNDMGILLFTKFPLRIFKVFLKSIKEKPVSNAALVTMQELFGDVSDISDSNLLTMNPLGKLTSPLEIFDSATTAAGLDIALTPFEDLFND